ncbi:Gfo/Idh/MocA family oxidoreductase [Streptomyces antimycoticus]|uniref:Gfo/Idh/MocA family oxidoreductase n=1 Tax=Streptomyces antimycoticus TaxID=68175 RepID=UPI0037D75C29
MPIGIMGLGRIGAFHTETLSTLDAGDSLAVTDPVAAAATTAAQRFGARAVASPEAVLAAGVDGVVIAAATDAHPEFVLAAVRAGVPVFCEKPVARTIEEIYATGANRGAEYIAAAGDVDTASALLTLDDGTLAVVSNTRHNPRGDDARLELHGMTDSIAAVLEDSLPLRSVEPGATFPGGTPHHFFMDRFSTAYRAELTAFTEVAAGLRPSPRTVADAVEAGWIAEACTLSLHEHRPVSTEEVRKA